MSVGFSIKHDLGALARDLQDMGAKAPAILARSLNRAATAGKTAMTRAIVQDTGIASKYVGRQIILFKANWIQQVTALEITGARLPLIAFKAKQTKKGVSYNLGRGRTMLKGGFIRNVKARRSYEIAAGEAFIGPSMMHTGVFVRKGPSRSRKGLPAHSPGLPIREPLGPSLTNVFAKYVEPIFRPATLAALMKNLRHEIDRANRPSAEMPISEDAA